MENYGLFQGNGRNLTLRTLVPRLNIHHHQVSIPQSKTRLPEVHKKNLLKTERKAKRGFEQFSKTNDQQKFFHAKNFGP